MRSNSTRLLLAGLALASLAPAPRLNAQVFTYTCSTASGTECRSQIPDARGNGVTVVAGVLSSTITVPPGTCGGLLADIDLTYRYYHDWKGDLAFELDPPGGPPVPAGTGVPVDSGDDFEVPQPVFLTSFPALSGQSPNGAWTLRASDRRNAGVGALDDWTLSLVCQTGSVALPTVSVLALPAAAGEQPLTPGAFVFSRNIVDSSPLSVSFTLAGTASGADYAAVPLTVTIPANQASATVLISPVADGIVEPPETVLASVVDLPAYDPGSPAAATVTISDAAALDVVPTAGPLGLVALALALAAAGAALLRFRLG